MDSRKRFETSSSRYSLFRSMGRHVWYVLCVTSNEGDAVLIARPGSVDLTDEDKIEHFKGCVRAKNGRKLSSMDVSDLVVYATVANAKAGNTPITEDEEIGHYGRSMHDALAVVVPSNHMVALPALISNLPHQMPHGPEIQLTSDGLLEFLENEMFDATNFHVLPHELSKSDLAFRLSGRDIVLQRAAKCMQELSRPTIETSKVSRKIPVCAGMQGLGKSRMLEEWETIFDLAGIEGPRLGVIVFHSNGHEPQAIEKSMTIEASFSWRLLHRLFIEGNGKTFEKWLCECLPRNAAHLRLHTALEVIRAKSIKMGIATPEETLNLFIGVDDFQVLKRVNGIRNTMGVDGKREDLLHDLLRKFGNKMSAPVDSVRIYPMFAGSDVSAISIVNSSNVYVDRLPLQLLGPNEIENAVASAKYGKDLLMYSSVRRHLFHLGGVPRWSFDFINYLQNFLNKKMQEKKGEVLTTLEIDRAFSATTTTFVDSWGADLDSSDLLKLAAYCVSGVVVEKSSQSVGGLKWSRLQDTSLCLLNEKSEVTIPYAIFRRIGQLIPNEYSDPERCFIECVLGLIDKVDSRIYDKPPWALWEVFGAYFHALRINAMMIIGKPVVTLSELFKGALVKGCCDQVQLIPTNVLHRYGNMQDQYNWLTDGLVVINGENGAGVDIFFALKKYNQQGYVVCVDQRNSAATTLDSKLISKLLLAAAKQPTELREPITVVPMLFSCFRTGNVEELAFENAVVVTYNQMNAYHSGLWLHPASSPFVNVNDDPASYIKMILAGNGEAIQKVAARISGKSSTKRKFETIDGFRAAVKRISPDVELVDEDRIVFR
ncbi:Aste57867_1808 [Aphanomyces stellatus]|uniref:Aste57867_1808 protein n=1 Tax=Aphanomyces stellatus TaxID=120398 RepID=A0A485K742_9STRA|nr:hypothetical protein As57867_001806 [Aphanomyces stellatus]VFT79017.1 Aste57867_1808 [Aphanomyces stellatus]